ncbi:CELSR3, partial [Symbiodinium sp. KB8]
MSHTAQVRVLMYELSSPDYDSGWFEFNSQDAYYSFKDIPHGFPGIPDEVRMLVRSIDDPNRHFVFEGRSFTQTQDWWGDYGGITYLPHSQFIRLRAPSREHGAWFGYSVFIGMGWGDDNYFQASVESQVRVQAWKERTPPQFSVPFGPVSLVADQECYTDITFGQNDNVASEGGLTNVTTLGLDVLPGHFSVRMKPSAGSDWALDATGMLQNHGIIWWNGHDGVTFAYNGSQVRLWMPSVDANLDIFPVTRNRPWRNYYGWARGWGGTESSTAVMGIKVWGARPYAKRDTMAFNVEVSNLREPPIAKDSVVQLSEAVAGTTLNGNEVIKVTATDDDIGDTLTFSIISGNTGYAFAIDSGTGMITVNNSDMIDYETYPFFHLAISISDQIFSTVSMVTVEVLDVNDPCTVFPAEMEAEENLPENALVGDVIQAYDPDVDQTLLFSIVGGNWNESFGINPCSGQIYVNYPSLNYELYPVYNLTVMVTDDGVPPTSDTAQVIIQLIDVNDKPYFLGRTMFVSENLLAGQVASILPVHDEDNDTLAFKFISGNSVGYFDIAIDGLDPITLHPQYVLRMSDKVVATGDGTARLADGTRDPTVPLDALVLNYEDPLRSNPIFKMKIYVVDDSNVPLDDRSAAETFTVYIVDENDPIRADAKQTLTISEDALPSSFVGRGIRTEDEDRLFWNGVARSDDPVFAMVDSPPDLPFELEETTGQIVLTNELDYESDAFYYFNVTAADQGGIVRFIQVTIAIDDVNEPPFLANQTFTPDENQQAGFVIGKLMADDPDFDEKLNYTIVSGDPDKLFAIAPGNDGELALRKDGLDYEAVSEYELNVTVTDKDGVTVWAYVWIEVVNKNDPPSFSSCPAPEDRDVVWDRRPAFSAIQGLIVQPGLITDLDNLFDLASGTTVASVDECESACEQNLDCAAYTFFDADYELTNWQGHCYGRSGFQNTMAPITLPDLSPDYSVQSGLRVQACIAEHLAENTPPSDPDDLHDNVITVEDFEADPFDVAIVSGNPDGAFELVEITPSTFRVKIARDVLDFETTPLYLLELEAVDSSNSTASVVYAITIDDVNEPPVLLPANLSVREFDSAGLRVGLPIGVWDPDVSHGDSVTFSLTSATNPSFDIETETGQLLLVQDIPSGIAPTTFQLTITATDSKGLTDVRTYDVSVSDTNAYPEFNADNLAAARTVMENAVAGTEVLPRVIVTDENVEDTLTYTMLKITPEVEGRKLFALDSATGHITLKDVSALNYECSRRSPRPNCPEPYRQFNMTIRVEDDAVDQLGAEAFILIDIADVSEAPIHPSAITVEINETYPSGTRLLYAPSITIPSNPVIIPDYYDDDRDIISYSLDPAVFAGGAIEFSVASVSAYDYDHLLPFALPIAVSNPYNTFPEQQTPLFTLVRGDLDHEAQGSYSTTLKMSDGEHNIDIPVTIVVADVPERPYFEEDSYAFDVDENSPGGLTIGR